MSYGGVVGVRCSCGNAWSVRDEGFVVDGVGVRGLFDVGFEVLYDRGRNVGFGGECEQFGVLVGVLLYVVVWSIS